MLLPDNVHPENTVYFNGSIVLEALQKQNIQELFELYQNVRSQRNMSFPIFILCLDWLYLIDAAEINSEGKVKLCL
ncbi:MAG: ABC-three component system middle component 6 [bacterium]